MGRVCDKLGGTVLGKACWAKPTREGLKYVHENGLVIATILVTNT